MKPTKHIVTDTALVFILSNLLWWGIGWLMNPDDTHYPDGLQTFSIALLSAMVAGLYAWYYFESSENDPDRGK